MSRAPDDMSELEHAYHEGRAESAARIAELEATLERVRAVLETAYEVDDNWGTRMVDADDLREALTTTPTAEEES